MIATRPCLPRVDAAHRRPRRLLRALLGLLFLGLSAIAWAAPSAPRIGVATMLPGEIFFERFGHNAIVVEYPGAEPVSYNFGIFDPGEDGFVGRFVHGDMVYRLAELPWNEDLRYYRETGRGVRIQWLDLAPAQAEAMARALTENARPENARYRYDYFTDNCATRVRDAIDRALGGDLRRQLTSRSRGNTYRSEAVRLARPAWWMRWGFDVGLGPAADAPMSLWEEAYVPMRLAEGLREARLPDGRPLVAAEEEVAPHRVAPEPAEQPQPWSPWLLAGLGIALAWRLLHARAPRTALAIAGLFWCAAALLGSVMLLLWVGTEHRFAWANRNLLLFLPTAWLLLPGLWRGLRGRAPGRLFRGVLVLQAIAAALAVFVYWLANPPQADAHWIALLVPIHVALWRGAGRVPAAA